MGDTFKPDEFVEHLKNGVGKASDGTAIPTIKGMIKLGNNAALEFSPGTSCREWISLPSSIIHSIEHHGTVICKDHQHELVDVTLSKGESPETTALVRLVKALSAKNERTAVPNKSLRQGRRNPTGVDHRDDFTTRRGAD